MVSIRLSEDLTVEVRINEDTRFLVDTGAAVSVLDAAHMIELYDGKPPPLAPDKAKCIKTVSGQDMPVCGILATTLRIAGDDYPCEFKVIEGVTYRGVLGRDFLQDHGAHIYLDTNTIQLQDKLPVTFSDNLLAVIGPATYIVPAHYVNKTYVCLTNTHSFMLQTKYFHWFS